MKSSNLANSRTVEDEAARWLVRRDAGDWSEDDQSALDRWLDASTAHVVAYVRLETAWQTAHRLKSLGAGAPEGVVLSRRDWSDRWQFSPFFDERKALTFDEHVSARRPWFGYGLAASLIVVAVAGILALVWQASPPVYRTPVGGLASIPMADGSKIILNTDSEVKVILTDTERRIQLERGEAFFEVAKDSNRPFVVAAGDRQVTAVGTAFAVRREQNNIRVAVTEGKVRMEMLAPPLTRAGRQDQLLLSAGSMAHGKHDRVWMEQKPISELEEALSWRVGYLVLHETTVADAVAEFNRYNTRKIVINDPAIAAVRLSGKFQSTQYEAFIRLLEDGFPIRAVESGERILLIAR